MDRNRNDFMLQLLFIHLTHEGFILADIHQQAELFKQREGQAKENAYSKTKDQCSVHLHGTAIEG